MSIKNILNDEFEIALSALKNANNKYITPLEYLDNLVGDSDNFLKYNNEEQKIINGEIKNLKIFKSKISKIIGLLEKFQNKIQIWF